MLSISALVEALASNTVAVSAGALAGVILLSFVFQALEASRRCSAARKLGGMRKIHRLDSTLPLLENTLDMAWRSSQMHHFVTESCLQFKGEPILIKSLGSPDLLTVCTPEAVEDVTKNQFENFPKGDYMLNIFRDILGDGIFAVDGLKWVHQRKTAVSLFTTNTLRDSMTSAIQEHALDLYGIFQRASAQPNQTLDLFKVFNRFTMEAFAEIAFGVRMGRLNTEEEHPFQTAFDEVQKATVQRFIWPRWVWKALEWTGVGLQGRFPRNLSVINSTVLNIIQQILSQRINGASTESKNIVSLFVDSICSAPDADAQELDPVFLRDIVINFLIAGRDTTAQALSWFFFEVSRNPHVEAAIRRELVEKIPALMKGEVVSPTFEQVGELVYLEAVVKETLRLHPSVPLMTKHAAKDTVLSDGTFVAADTLVAIPVYAMGRMPHIWGPDAAEFKPERWVDETTGKLVAVSTFQFPAFNAGPRSCIGRKLALLELKLVVAGLMSKFHVEVQQPEDVTYDFSLSLPVKGALNANISCI